MADQNSNPWQVVSETPASQQTPAQAQPASTDQSNSWQVVSQSPQTQPFTDEHLERMRQLNENRPWWRKMLGLGPSEDQMTTEDKAQEEKFWNDQKERMKDALRDNYKARADVPVGAVKAAGRSGVGIANLGIKGYDKITGADKPTLTSLITGKRGHEIEMPKALESDGSEGQELGGMFENVLEFLAGDAALKALTMSQKLSLGLRIAKVAESSPAAARLLRLGLNASRTGVVSGTQEAVHGGSTSEVLTSAGTGALTSVGSDVFGDLVKLARPGTKQIAGETLQTLPTWKSAGTAARVAEANQGSAKAVLANVAHDAADAITQRFGQAAPETIRTFRDAAQAVEKAAKPVYETLDKISGGQFQAATNELNAANKIARRAASMADLQAAEKSAADAQAKIDKIFADSEGKIAPEDLKNAKSAWRAKKVLEQLHGKIDAAYDIPQSAADISGADRTLLLQKLQGRLNAAFKKIPQADLQNVLGQQGTTNLFELAKLGADPLKAKSLSDVATALGEHLGIGGAGLAVGAMAGHAVPGGSAALGIHFLYAHPEIGQYVAKALSVGTSPKLVVPAVIRLIDQQRQDNQ